MSLYPRFYPDATVILKVAKPGPVENLVIPFPVAMLMLKTHLAAKGFRLDEQHQPSAEQLAELMKEVLHHG